MHRAALLLAVVSLAGGVAASIVRAPSVPVEAPGPGTGWRLAFADEFDGDVLDTGTWVTCYWWDDGGCTNLSTDEQQWYRPDQVTVSDGSLQLTAIEARRATADDSFSFASGMVTSGRGSSDLGEATGFAFQYGYVEARIKIPAGDGLWPALWLLPVTHDSKPEIDIAEFLGQSPRRMSMHLHWRDAEGERRSAGHAIIGPDFSADWHVVAVNWTPERVTWYLDDVPVWTTAEHVPAEPMYIIANLAVGGDYAGPTDPADFPATFAVDYIRVWQTDGSGS